jgi:hypothetical protein
VHQVRAVAEHRGGPGSQREARGDVKTIILWICFTAVMLAIGFLDRLFQ